MKKIIVLSLLFILVFALNEFSFSQTTNGSTDTPIEFPIDKIKGKKCTIFKNKDGSKLLVRVLNTKFLVKKYSTKDLIVDGIKGPDTYVIHLAHKGNEFKVSLEKGYKKLNKFNIQGYPGSMKSKKYAKSIAKKITAKITDVEKKTLKLLPETKTDKPSETSEGETTDPTSEEEFKEEF